MKGIFIDSEKREVREVEYNDWKDISPMIGCRIFTVADFNDKGDCVYVDDEGLLTLRLSSMFFEIEGYPQPLAGNGLVCGTDDEGASTEPSVSVEEVKKIVKFYRLDEVRKLFN